VQWVAFVRNLNVGQRGHASTEDLIGAFVEAGCSAVRSFQSNGTVIFEGNGPELADIAMLVLAEKAGVEREAFAMASEELVELVEYFGSTPDAARRELTLHGGGVLDLTEPDVVREAAIRRCTLVAAGDGWAVLTNERDRESNATPVVERLVNGPATSRGFPTLTRLVAKLG
jgi:uncharacterized protein (DUF1697 family)